MKYGSMTKKELAAELKRVLAENRRLKKQAGRTAKRTREWLMTASVSAGVALWDWDMKSGRLEWSDGIDALLGYRKGKFGRTIDAWCSIIHPEDLPRVDRALTRHRQGHVPYGVEYRVRRSDGTWRWWYDSGTAECDRRGRAVRMTGACVDITDRKEMEERLVAVNRLLVRQKEELHKTLAPTAA